ncbi:hypothetical protein L1887_62724 [Cichorium endivia]|nr:hypothetical protein L1887_62724 [Cichorium endivia]
MATPASSAYAFHHRFDAVQAKDAPAAASANANGTDVPSAARSSADNYSYPDLDAGQFYSSSAAHSSTAAPAPNALPDFPEFKGFDSKSDLFQTNNLFQQYSAQPTANAAALVEPQSAQIEESSSSDQLHAQPAVEPSSKPETAPRTSRDAEAHPTAPQPPLAQDEPSYQPQLERHFSSASSYVQHPSLHADGPSSSPQAPPVVQRSPLPRPPSMPASPPTHHTTNSLSHDSQPQSPPNPAHPSQSASAFTFPPQHPASAQAPQQPARTQDPNTLPVDGLRLNDGQSAPQPAAPNRDDNFFGMQRPAAARSPTAQPLAVPPTTLADDDGFYQDQQHLNQSNASGQPASRDHDSTIQPPRPSSFFGAKPACQARAAPPCIAAKLPFRAASPPLPEARATHPCPHPEASAASAPQAPIAPPASRPPSQVARSSITATSASAKKPRCSATGKTLELYRQNAKKTNDPNLIYELAVFMIDAAKTMGTDDDANGPVAAVNGPNKLDTEKAELIKEATGLLKKIADRGHPDAQYFLADCYANGIGTRTGKQDFGQAYTYFVLAAKHGHPDAAYRAGTCYEKGWGCRKDAGKALQFYRKSAAQSHPGAMYRLATAELNGELGLKKNAKEGVKWLKRSAEAATPEFPHALHELALLHERGIDNVLFVDPEYSCELLAQAGEMGYAPSAYKLGVNYEYGRMGCPQDGGLSIHMYNIAAQQNHKEACFALTAWYLVGAPGILPQSDTEAYLWAKKAAEQGLAKAEYAVGYFTEMGIGTTKDLGEARAWYKRAADHGDKRANQRIAALQGRGGPTGGPTGMAGVGSQKRQGQQQQRLEMRQEQLESMNEFGRRAQPTSAPFPASVTQSSMTPSTQMNYPSPIAMREAQTAQREQQYMANVAAQERAQARAMLQHSPSPNEMGSPVSGSPNMGLPRPPPMPYGQHGPPQPVRQGYQLIAASCPVFAAANIPVVSNECEHGPASDGHDASAAAAGLVDGWQRRLPASWSAALPGSTGHGHGPGLRRTGRTRRTSWTARIRICWRSCGIHCARQGGSGQRRRGQEEEERLVRPIVMRTVVSLAFQDERTKSAFVCNGRAWERAQLRSSLAALLLGSMTTTSDAVTRCNEYCVTNTSLPPCGSDPKASGTVTRSTEQPLPVKHHRRLGRQERALRSGERTTVQSGLRCPSQLSRPRDSKARFEHVCKWPEPVPLPRAALETCLPGSQGDLLDAHSLCESGPRFDSALASCVVRSARHASACAAPLRVFRCAALCWAQHSPAPPDSRLKIAVRVDKVPGLLGRG